MHREQVEDKTGEVKAGVDAQTVKRLKDLHSGSHRPHQPCSLKRSPHSSAACSSRGETDLWWRMLCTTKHRLTTASLCQFVDGE